jgi:hypothetical protein
MQFVILWRTSLVNISPLPQNARIDGLYWDIEGSWMMFAVCLGKNRKISIDITTG